MTATPAVEAKPPSRLHRHMLQCWPLMVTPPHRRLFLATPATIQATLINTHSGTSNQPGITSNTGGYSGPYSGDTGPCPPGNICSNIDRASNKELSINTASPASSLVGCCHCYRSFPLSLRVVGRACNAQCGGGTHHLTAATLHSSRTCCRPHAMTTSSTWLPMFAIGSATPPLLQRRQW